MMVLLSLLGARKPTKPTAASRTVAPKFFRTFMGIMIGMPCKEFETLV